MTIKGNYDKLGPPGTLISGLRTNITPEVQDTNYLALEASDAPYLLLFEDGSTLIDLEDNT